MCEPSRPYPSVVSLLPQEPADGAPDFRIDRYGLAVSPFAVRPSPFALHVDHHVPVACGGATEAGNLEAVQHRFNHYKRDRCGLGLGHGLGWLGACVGAWVLQC